MFRPACLILIALILIPSITHAKTETIFADHKYVMGDNDSKNDARRMCFLEAKRKVLEKAGTYIESHTQAINYQLTKDEINSYSAALLKVETVKEEWKFVGENMAVFLTVKAKVDTGSIEKQLAKIKKDVSVQKKIKSQQSQIRELERRFRDLQKQLGKADSSKALTLRKERKEIYQEIDDIEARHKYILSKMEERKETQRAKEIESVNTVRKFINNIEIGMTIGDVKYMFGEPDRTDKPSDKTQGYSVLYFYYGNVCVSTKKYIGEDQHYIVERLSYMLPIKYCGQSFWYAITKQLRDEITLKKKDFNVLLGEKITIITYASYTDECISYIKKNAFGPSKNINFLLHKNISD